MDLLLHDLLAADHAISNKACGQLFGPVYPFCHSVLMQLRSVGPGDHAPRPPAANVYAQLLTGIIQRQRKDTIGLKMLVESLKRFRRIFAFDQQVKGSPQAR